MSFFEILAWTVLGVVGAGIAGGIIGLAAAMWIDALLDDIID